VLHLLCVYCCSAVLIGEPGVGKTSIVHGLAQRLVAGDVPESIRGAKVIGLELGLLMAGGVQALVV
jgi:ATP-dependent Clp protease ATP-binding subunit ClpB